MGKKERFNAEGTEKKPRQRSQRGGAPSRAGDENGRLRGYQPAAASIMFRMRLQESPGPAVPRLEVHWERRSRNFLDSLHAVLSGPRPASRWPSSPFFRVTWVRPRFPGRGVFASVLWHILLINISIPLGHLAGTWFKPERKLLPPRIEITWYGPAQDLAPLVAPAAARQPSPPGKREKPLARRGAQAFHPRATILSLPSRPSSPRQTLIRPFAPPQPPKILPAMPNVIAWNQTPPARPLLPVPPASLAMLHPKAPRAQPAPAPAPELPNQEKQLGPLDIARSALASLQPQLPLAPSSVAAPQARTEKPTTAAAPEISPSSAALQVIALSIAPGNAPAPPANAQATLIASPEGTRLGVPGGAPEGAPATQGGAGNAPVAPGGTGTMAGAGALGPPNLVIRSAAGLQAAGPGAGPASGAVAAVIPPAFALPLPPKPEPHFSPILRRAPSGPTASALRPSTIARRILGPGRIHSMLINMPNLTSATGSWVIDFSELGEEGPAAGHLVGPDPTRKVDPRYPPELAAEHVEGEVVLYAIIRSDGTVGPIRIVKGLDPTLDQNAAAAFARWEFHPATRDGKPVDLAAVVHIPFRPLPPL
jgi:TonB family protein